VNLNLGTAAILRSRLNYLAFFHHAWRNAGPRGKTLLVFGSGAIAFFYLANMGAGGTPPIKWTRFD